mmetsp:Transcript_6435/g.20277  ORF Transcript_6435/g.20277 Transcript_6435/m.20277 type:complete len:210 (+) Transcript_6435:639-1268(+)
MLRQLREQELLVPAGGLGLGDALLQHAEPVGVVCHLGQPAHHGVVDPVRAGRQEAVEEPLHDVRAVGVQAEVQDVAVQGGHEPLLLLGGPQQPDQGLESVRAPAVAGDGGGLRGQALQHPAPLPRRAGLEGRTAEVVPVGVAHELGHLPLHLPEDDVHHAGMALEELPLEVLAAGLRPGELHDLPPHVAELRRGQGGGGEGARGGGGHR